MTATPADPNDTLSGTPAPAGLLDMDTPVKVTLRDAVKQIAQETADAVITKHIRNCPVVQKMKGAKILMGIIAGVVAAAVSIIALAFKART